jgi:carboxypeptidase PM20D1
MTTMMKAVLPLASAFLLLFGIVVARTATFRAARVDAPRVPVVEVPAGAAERLAGAVRFRTVSNEDPAAFDGAAFAALHAYLEASFPRVHATLRREVVSQHSLLYTWEGSDPSLRPILLMGHLDVVPVEPGQAASWTHDPFGGEIADGFVWGRGAIDNKAAIVGTLEAVEMLLAEGFRPARTIHLAYGHDEEVGGARGAKEIAALLERRGVELEMVLDEGGVIGDGLFPGIDAPVALVGVAEKGFLSVELAARSAGGHSSLPPRQSTIGILSTAIARLEEHPMPARIQGASSELFQHIGPAFPLVRRALFANLWLTQGLVTKTLERSPTTNAMVRTTMAATIFQAGSKDNVLPSQARAVLNFRILPGDSIEAVLGHVRRVVADERIEVRAVGRFSAEPSDVSSSNSESFRTLARTIQGVVPGALVAPYLVVVVTDSRYFAPISRNVFRFLPVRLASRDLERMHGVDERLDIRDYETAIRLYRQLLVNASVR